MTKYTNADIKELYKIHPYIQQIIKRNVSTKEFDLGHTKEIRTVFAKGLFLTGGVGVGKTYALYSIYNQLPYGDKVYINWVELMFSLRDRVGNGSVKDTLDHILSNRFIFIDDLGAENHSNFDQETVYFLIDSIYNRNKSLFLATNLSIDAFTNQYGDRIVDRLGEMCEIVEMKGESLRV